MTSREKHIAQANENIEKDRSCVHRIIGKLTDLDELLSCTQDDLASIQGGTDIQLSSLWMQLGNVYNGLCRIESGLDSPEQAMKDIRRFLENMSRGT